MNGKRYVAVTVHYLSFLAVSTDYAGFRWTSGDPPLAYLLLAQRQL